MSSNDAEGGVVIQQNKTLPAALSSLMSVLEVVCAITEGGQPSVSVNMTFRKPALHESELCDIIQFM